MVRAGLVNVAFCSLASRAKHFSLLGVTKKPIINYQMSKVGSTAVEKSLYACKSLAVFQVHNLRTKGIEASLWSPTNRNQRVYSELSGDPCF